MRIKGTFDPSILSTLAKGLFTKDYKASPRVTKNRKDSKVFFQEYEAVKGLKLCPSNVINTSSQSRIKRININFKIYVLITGECGTKI